MVKHTPFVAMSNEERKRVLNRSDALYLIVGLGSIGIAVVLQKLLPQDFPFYRVVALGWSFVAFSLAWIIAWVAHRQGNKRLPEALRKPALWFVLVCGLSGNIASTFSPGNPEAGSEDAASHVIRLVVGGFIPVIVAGILSIMWWPGYESEPASPGSPGKQPDPADNSD